MSNHTDTTRFAKKIEMLVDALDCAAHYASEAAGELMECGTKYDVDTVAWFVQEGRRISGASSRLNNRMARYQVGTGTYLEHAPIKRD